MVESDVDQDTAESNCKEYGIGLGKMSHLMADYVSCSQSPNRTFHNLEPQNPSIDDSKLSKILQSTSLERGPATLVFETLVYTH